jgi:hypothetical protein
MYKSELGSFFRVAVPIGLSIIALLTACATKGATITTAQGKTSVPYGQPLGLSLGPGSTLSLPQMGNNETLFTVGENDAVSVSGEIIILPNGTIIVPDEKQSCNVSMSTDGRTETPVNFTVSCDQPAASSSNSSPSQVPTP